VGALAQGLSLGHLLLGQDRDRFDLDEQVVADQTRDLDERAGRAVRSEVFLAGHGDLLAAAMFLRNTVTLQTSANVAPAAARHFFRFSWTCRACAVASVLGLEPRTCSFHPSTTSTARPSTKISRCAISRR
jgi:hypothetical protein